MMQAGHTGETIHMDTNTKSEQPAQSQTPYQTPEIIDYGWMESITQAGGVTASDGISGSGIV
jgi:hypothetical protein